MTTVVQPGLPRCTVSEDLGGLRIVIPSKWNWSVLFLLVWISFWTWGGIFAVRGLLRHFNLFLCIWLIAWLFGELSAGYAILYAIGGREVVVANSETLTWRKQIFGLGLAKCYLVREMRNLRFQRAGSASNRRIPSRIVFDYGAGTVGFAADLDESEAEQLISRIRQRCAIPVASTPQETGIKFWQPR